MPLHIKAMVSALVTLVGIGAFLLERANGNTPLDWIVLGLAVMMLAALWMFPETKKK